MKSPAALLGAALVPATLTAPAASATTLADPAPTNVQISWKDSTLKYIHITWGKTWFTVGPAKVKNGLGTGYIRAPKPGRTAYRYYVPAVMQGGLYYAASYTPTFVNVVV